LGDLAGDGRSGPDDTSLLHGTSSHGADSGYAWGLLIHGLLEHAMQRKDATRADLERMAHWLTVEFPELRPHIPNAVEIIDHVTKAPFWQEARNGAECHVEVPFATKQSDAAGLVTVVRGVIDLVYRPADRWRILDYKTDQVRDAAVLVDRYMDQIEQYARAWSRVAAVSQPTGALYAVRTEQVVEVIAHARPENH
jgi:ATP-dependent exoDNAse (exonuclease V) beta subunit